MTTTPRIWTVEIMVRIASTATPLAPSLSPRPTQRAAARAAASVTRTSSRARLRSGESGAGSRLSVMGPSLTVGGCRTLCRRVAAAGRLLDREPHLAAGREPELGDRLGRDVGEQVVLSRDQQAYGVTVRSE